MIVLTAFVMQCLCIPVCLMLNKPSSSSSSTVRSVATRVLWHSRHSLCFIK